jgi:hypothetical protein
MKTRASLVRLMSMAVRIGAHFFPRMVGALLLGSAIAWASSAMGQTNAEPELAPTGVLYNLTPVAKAARIVLWSVASVFLVIAAAVLVLRHMVKPSFYKAVTDTHWQEDAQQEAGVVVGESEVLEACADFKAGTQEASTAKPSVLEAVEEKKPRLYTPASGPEWTEPMLNAFIASCLRANCLGRAWQEEAAYRVARDSMPPEAQREQPSRRLPDPREAEFLRKLKVRWQEFEVDPDTGIFVEHAAAGSGKSHVCILEVAREKHKVARAALNAGFVIESLGRYLMASDQVYPTRPGYYHAPDGRELAALAPEQKQHLIRVKNIPDPWKAMIGGPETG